MSSGHESYLNKHNFKTQHVICLTFHWTFEEIATLMMNYIKRTIDGVEKAPTEYKFHLDGDIFAVVNVFKTYRFVHIRHYRDETYPLDGVCYYSNHFEDLVKLLEKNEKGIQANGNISVKRSKNGVTIERKDKRTSITLKNVALENLLKR